METIDILTIVFTEVIVEIICTLVIVALWLQNRKRFAGMNYWVASFALQTLGLLLFILRQSIGDWISIISSNTLIIAGAVLCYQGLERFVDKCRSQTHNYVMLAILPLLLGYFVFVQPNLMARTIIFTFALLIICLQCLWLMLKGIEAPVRRLTRGIGIVFGIYCLICVTRIVAILVHPFLGSDYFHSGIAEAFVQIAFVILFILLTYSLVLMVNNRLLLAIQIQEEKYSKAFHSSPYAIILTRLSDGKIFEANAGFEKITGYPLKEVIGKTTGDLHIWMHPEDRKQLIEALRQKGSVQGLELQLNHKSGTPITVLYSAEIITVNNQQCILASINDITDRKRAEVERERLVAEREKAVLEVRTLSGLLPICASCKKIRDDNGYWNQIESYIKSHSAAEFSHSICPECFHRLYPEYESDPE